VEPSRSGEGDDDEEDGDDPASVSDPANPDPLLRASQLPPADADAIVRDRSILVTRLLGDQALRTRLVKYLVRVHGVPDFDADDIVDNALERAAYRSQTWPADNAPLFKWARSYVKFQFLRTGRTESVRSEREQLDENIEEHSDEDPELERAAGVARVAARLAEGSAQDAETLAMLRRRAEGVPLVAIAADAQISEDAADKRIHRFALRVRERWEAWSAAAAVACAVIFFLVHAQIPPPKPQPHAENLMRDLPEVPAPPTPETLRRVAERRCDATQWESCLAFLDRAARVDPAGDQTPAVQALRTRAHDSIQKRDAPPPPPAPAPAPPPPRPRPAPPPVHPGDK
jgi:DNA-directed RNA polymerase specialized sigma24 family protein